MTGESGRCIPSFDHFSARTPLAAANKVAQKYLALSGICKNNNRRGPSLRPVFLASSAMLNSQTMRSTGIGIREINFGKWNRTRFGIGSALILQNRAQTH